jgi:hypothetical protein
MGGAYRLLVLPAQCHRSDRLPDDFLDNPRLGLSESTIGFKSADRDLQDFVYQDTEGERVERKWLLGFIWLTPSQGVAPDKPDRVAQKQL